MNMMTTIGMRRCDRQLEIIRAEFGAVIAARILEAEAVDFFWEARVQERYLGQYLDYSDMDRHSGEDLSRMAFLSHLDGRWCVGICLVDGEGDAVDLLWKRRIESFSEAHSAFERAR